MPSGLEIYNDSGVLQIGTGSTNYYMIEKGTTTVTPGAVGVGTTTITPSNSFDIICLNTSDTTFWVRPPPIISANGLMSSYTAAWYSADTSSHTISWWCFRKYTALSAATSGQHLELYNADGTVAFSTQQPKIMRVFSKIPITSFPTYGSTTTTTCPSGVTLGWCMYGQLFQTYTSSGPMGEPVDRQRATRLRQLSGQINWRMEGPAGRSNGSDIVNGGFVPINVTDY